VGLFIPGGVPLSKVTRTKPQSPAVKPPQDDRAGHDKKKGKKHDQKPAPHSSFEASRASGLVEVQGRVNVKGNSDDSIGRRNAKGNADDSIGRRNARGNADDSIGRVGAQGIYVKGQLVHFSPLSQRGTGTSANGQSMSRTPGRTSLGGVGGVGSKDLMRATNGLNKNAQQLAQALSMQGDAATNSVLASGNFQKLAKDDRESIINLLAQGGPSAAPAMAKLFKNNQQSVLLQKDEAGNTVLRNLEHISQSKRSSLAGEALADIADPHRIQQGYAPTCTATSMQYEFAKERPAEYARLMRDLAVDGRARMAGGGVLEVPVNAALSASEKNSDARTASEALFQSAVMEYANGADDYNLAKQKSSGARGDYRGLFPDQIRDMTAQLFGARYETREIRDDDEARDELALIASRERPNRPVLFDISMGSFNHNVSLESVDDKRVSYRDPTTGDITSLTRDEFISRLTSVHYAVD
jgi:hypothetical protein